MAACSASRDRSVENFWENELALIQCCILWKETLKMKARICLGFEKCKLSSELEFVSEISSSQNISS
jgi:hypothetical protein